MNSLILIEGVPGSGKSTLLNALSAQFPSVPVYREGDLSPIELAWCAEMSQEAYQDTVLRYPDLAAEIEAGSCAEGSRQIVAYTHILTEDRSFYQDMERFEIYGGRRPIEEFRQIVLRRFANYAALQRQNPHGAIFECSLFQNIIEELMLFACYQDEDILAFYREVFAILQDLPMTLIRLIPQDLSASIQQIRKERVDDEGNEVWYQLMLGYLAKSPYGEMHHFSGFDDLLAHFRRRMRLEELVITDSFPGRYLELTSRVYDLPSICSNLTE